MNEMPSPPVLTIDWEKVDEGLNENQKEALRLIAAGWGHVEASKEIGMDRTTVSKWLSTSARFMRAYEGVKVAVRLFNEAMLEFVTTTTWLRINQYLSFNPMKMATKTDLSPTVRRALIAEQGKIIRQLTSGLRPQKIQVERKETPALLHATPQAIDVLAARLQELESPPSDQQHPIEENITEYRALVAGSSGIEGVSTIGGIAVDWRSRTLQCPGCQRWYKDLGRHFSREHGLSIPEARQEFGLAEDAPAKFDAALRRPLDETGESAPADA